MKFHYYFKHQHSKASDSLFFNPLKQIESNLHSRTYALNYFPCFKDNIK